jgi:3-hydroxyacyl-[acyl-carrier-protein] dehydratase
MLARQEFDRMPLLAKVGQAKLRGMLRPGALLSVSARLVHDGSGYAVMNGRIDSEGQMAAEAEYTLRILPFPNDSLAAMVRGRGTELGL